MVDARDRAARAWQFGILARLDPVGAVSRRPLSGHPHRHAGLRLLHGADGYIWSAGALASDIARFLDALSVERCHLIGAKYGGSIALQLASDQPQRFLSLCIFGSPARGVGTGNADKIRAKGVRQWAAETMRSRLGSTASEAQLAWWTELMGATDQRAASAHRARS